MKRQVLSDRKIISKVSSFQAFSGNVHVLDQNIYFKEHSVSHCHNFYKSLLIQYTTADIRMLIVPHFVMTRYPLKMADTDTSFIRLKTDRFNWKKIPT